MAIKVLLFDLGGVIVRLGDTIFPEHWLPSNSSYSLHEWLVSPVAKSFETGSISAQEFAVTLKHDLGLKQSVDEVIHQFAAWPESLFPKSIEVLASLRSSYTLAALSNINELHAPRMIEEFHLDKYFDALFFSNELGLAKPDPSIYEKVIELLGVAPQEVVFFDDVENNVDAALKAGFNAHQVYGPESALLHIQNY